MGTTVNSSKEISTSEGEKIGKVLATTRTGTSDLSQSCALSWTNYSHFTGCPGRWYTSRRPAQQFLNLTMNVIIPSLKSTIRPCLKCGGIDIRCSSREYCRTIAGSEKSNGKKRNGKKNRDCLPLKGQICKIINTFDFPHTISLWFITCNTRDLP